MARPARASGALLLLAALGGCASVQGFPDQAVNSADRMKELESQLTQAAVTACSGPTATRTCRNEILDARIRASNIMFEEFERALYAEGIGAGVGTDWLTIAINAVGAISEAAAPELSALSAAIIGGRAAYEKRALYDLSLPVMMAQMSARRQEVLAQIRAGQLKEVSEYSLYRGLDDVDEYGRAGSIPSAMTQMVHNAGEQASEAQARLEQIELVGLVPADVQAQREPIAVKMKAAPANELSQFVSISGKTPSATPLVDALDLLSGATTAEAVQTLCARFRLAVPSSGGC